MRLILSSVILALSLLAGCSHQPVRTPPPVEKADRPADKQPAPPPAAQPATDGTLAELTRQLVQRWSQADDQEQLLIEYVLYSRWRHADAATLAAGWQDDDLVAPWALLATLVRSGDPAAVHKVLTLYPKAPFARHLAHALIQDVPAPKTISVLLPLSGRYAVVAEQIRQGLIKALHRLNRPDVRLRFYDTSGGEDAVLAAYARARDEGADTLIGPLRPEAVEVLGRHATLPTLFLNRPENLFGTALIYPTPSEAAQILAALDARGYQRVGVLHLQTPRAADLAATAQAMWQDSSVRGEPPRLMVSQPLSRRYKEIRRRLDQLIHIDRSQQRARLLQQRLGRQLSFLPRPRKDLQALLLITSPKEAAIIKPMLDFYDVRVPVYGSTLLMPTLLKKAQPNRDLAGITFPAFPVMTRPVVATTLQAWGHDALLLTLSRPPRNGCVPGLTGRLGLGEDNLWDRQLTWLKYTRDGRLIRVKRP